MCSLAVHDLNRLTTRGPFDNPERYQFSLRRAGVYDIKACGRDG